MALESVTHISDLNASNPTTSDGLSQGDDHIRNIKTALKTDFPNINGVVSASDEDLSACTNFEETISATTSEVSIATGKTLNIVDDGAGLKIGSTVIAASAADLNATTNFEETLSATADEVSVATGKTLNIVDDGAGLEFGGVALTATVAELNAADAPNGANKLLKLDANALAPIDNLPVDIFTGTISSVGTAAWSVTSEVLTLSNVAVPYGMIVSVYNNSTTSAPVRYFAVDENAYLFTNYDSASVPSYTSVSAGTIKFHLYNPESGTLNLSYRVMVYGTV